ncbi:MAG TPA: DUF4381 domain-containing protein [Gammaproteobacteria bacterium]|nr:DUF4381 domain-containing protein [Gammaproteobacteria bacterium]
MNPQTLAPQGVNPELLELRDIHLPPPVSWWPLAPGWWLLLVAVLILIIVFFITRKIHQKRQLKRDIHSELDNIKKAYQQTQNKSQLAKSLSVLLRRASISYYPDTGDTKNNIAGLTGKDWLAWLDSTNTYSQKSTRFQSDTGDALINAPYLPDDTDFGFDAQALIALTESWLLSKHKNRQDKHV